MRNRGGSLTSARCRGANTLVLALAGLLACEPPDPDLLPDERLRAELGLTDRDRVHTVSVATGESERAEPDSVAVLPGDLVQFVSSDWYVHEVAFDAEQLGEAQRAFLEGSGQMASPPLVQRDARFVLSFAEAPEGRYPFVLQGNHQPGRGVIVVARPSRFP